MSDRVCPGCKAPMTCTAWRRDENHFGGLRVCSNLICGYSHTWSFDRSRVPAMIGTTLMNERLAIGQGAGVDYEELLKLARDTELENGPAIKDSNVREKLADWYVQSQGLKYTKLKLHPRVSIPPLRVSIIPLWVMVLSMVFRICESVEVSN